MVDPEKNFLRCLFGLMISSASVKGASRPMARYLSKKTDSSNLLDRVDHDIGTVKNSLQQ